MFRFRFNLKGGHRIQHEAILKEITKKRALKDPVPLDIIIECLFTSWNENKWNVEGIEVRKLRADNCQNIAIKIGKLGEHYHGHNVGTCFQSWPFIRLILCCCFLVGKPGGSSGRKFLFSFLSHMCDLVSCLSPSKWMIMLTTERYFPLLFSCPFMPFHEGEEAHQAEPVSRF